MKTITANDARSMIEAGEAILVDIRSADERARAEIPGSVHMELDNGQKVTEDVTGKTVIFHCASGMRTAGAADRLSRSVQTDTVILDGGLNAWRKAGFEVREDKSAPMEMMRQVQITAGSLVVIGAALGLLVNPGFYGLSAFVGAGLVFSGVTGTCAMARLLSMMPWNQRPAATAQ